MAGLGDTLEVTTNGGRRPIAIALHFSNIIDDVQSTNEFRFLDLVWLSDLFDFFVKIIKVLTFHRIAPYEMTALAK